MKTVSLLVVSLCLAPAYARAQDSTFEAEDLEPCDEPLVEAPDEADPPLAAPPSPTASSPRVDDAALRAALARYAHDEPDVTAVIDAALATQAADPSRTRDALTRVRLSGWVPVVRVGVRRGFGEGLTAQDLATGDRTSLSATDSLALEGALTFRLDRLVYAREEAMLMREERAVSRERLHLVREVVTIYFERRRLQLERDLLGARDVAHAMRIAEAGSLLDVFTGGAFSRMLAERRRDAPHGRR